MPPLDPRRHVKERVLGIPSAAGGVAFPFGELEEAGDLAVVHTEVEGTPLVVFWSSESRAAVAYESRQAGRDALTFRAIPGGFQDVETGSRWRLDGRAVTGPLEGSRLRQIENAFVAFWGAWAAFHPGTDLWQSGEV